MQVYCDLLADLLKAYRKVQSHQDLLHSIRVPLVDVTGTPAYVAMDELMPLPPGFVQREYQLKDVRGAPCGTMDAAFHGNDLVNARTQLFFRGFLAGRKAQRFVTAYIAPILEAELGRPVVRESDHRIYRAKGLVAIARFVNAGPSVSTHITDEHFV